MWWNSITTLQQTLFIIAIIATAALMAVIALLLIEANIKADRLDNADVNAKANENLTREAKKKRVAFEFNMLHLRAAAAFFAVAGWIGYALCFSVVWYGALLLAIMFGLGAACAMALAVVGLKDLDPKWVARKLVPAVESVINETAEIEQAHA